MIAGAGVAWSDGEAGAGEELADGWLWSWDGAATGAAVCALVAAMPATTIPTANDTEAASRICAPKHFHPVLSQTLAAPRRFTAAAKRRFDLTSHSR